jgi:hypothetical protein
MECTSMVSRVDLERVVGHVDNRSRSYRKKTGFMEVDHVNRTSNILVIRLAFLRFGISGPKFKPENACINLVSLWER